MTDIDFDELDKAVSATLGPRAEKKEQAPAEAAAAKPAETAEPAAKTDETRSPMIQVQKRQTIVSPAAKRSGRFMDMVHPSSDMGQEKTVSAPSKVKIMPTENAPKPEPKPVASTEEVAKVEAEPAPAAAEAPAPSGPVYPDPLDVMESKPADEEKAAEPEKPSEVVEPTDPVEVATPADEPQAEEPAPEAAAVPEPVTPPATVAAGETPFIPDAKVEKRPLGGVAPLEPDATVEDAPTPVEAQDTQLPPEASLPPALQSDVVAVESDVVPELNGAVPALEKPEEADVKATAPAEKKDESTKPEPVSTISMSESIPQQYKSTAEHADETLRPVFDTEQYHQPLIPAHAGHKNHTLLFVLLILALLVVGAGLGYFAYISGF